MANPIAVLAYSGGLDTTVILHWLKTNGWDVATYTATSASPTPTSRPRSTRRRSLGAVDAYIEDLRAELVDEFFLPVLQMHARYEGRYLLGTSIARIPTARGQMRYAKRIGGNVLVHGSTGKGNDQVRFETVYRVLQEDPEYTLEDFGIYAPWKEADFLARFGDGGRRVMTAYSQRARHPAAQRRHRRGPAVLAGRQRTSHKLGGPRPREAGRRPPPGAVHLPPALGPHAGPPRARAHPLRTRASPVGVELLDEDRNSLGQGVEIGAERLDPAGRRVPERGRRQARRAACSTWSSRATSA